MYFSGKFSRFSRAIDTTNPLCPVGKVSQIDPPDLITRGKGCDDDFFRVEQRASSLNSCPRVERSFYNRQHRRRQEGYGFEPSEFKECEMKGRNVLLKNNRSKTSADVDICNGFRFVRYGRNRMIPGAAAKCAGPGNRRKTTFAIAVLMMALDWRNASALWLIKPFSDVDVFVFGAPDSDWFRPKYHSDNEQVNDQTVQGRTRSPGTPPVNKESEFITYLLITHELQRTRYAAAAARPHHGCGRRRYAHENPKNRRSDNGQKIVWLSGESRREKPQLKAQLSHVCRRPKALLHVDAALARPDAARRVPFGFSAAIVPGKLIGKLGIIEV
ncbi:hypothetical protein GEV33_013467 [Tenebrio molitor]|uniref:Uncharacterized protein n=1 Tax=Tenebrio molitor TaxID=7067 RepID=A0A8J6H8G4_TENMO|nr:hypothetical protein GEV33_013467 [Tenebrio molitor]